jgi:hypothetical protein
MKGQYFTRRSYTQFLTAKSRLDLGEAAQGYFYTIKYVALCYAYAIHCCTLPSHIIYGITMDIR